MTNTFRWFLLAGSVLFSGASIYALPPGAAPPQVSVHDVNAGAVVERGLCLTVALGAGAASECGDLRLAHALPTVRTLNQARTPVLIYNSQHARPHALVAANVTLPQGKTGLQRVTATLWIDGRARAKSTWSGASWPAGPARIALGFDAQSEATGVRRFILEVSAVYTGTTGETSETTRAVGALAIVNRKNSPFGAGWWLAGLEQLVLDPRGNPVLRVGGDGSVRPYSPVQGQPGRWAAPAVDRPDTLVRVGSTFERKLPGGALVRYDAGGRHVATRSRIGYETSFGYTDGRLSSVGVPPAGSGLSYGFVYGADGFLQRVEAPGARNVVLTRTGDELSIQDPDGTRVVFTHADGTRRRIVARRDRRGTTTRFEYDQGGKIAASRIDAAGIVTRLRAAESLGLTAAVDTAQAYVTLDGPRTDVGDSTRLWLDRWGAPRRIIDAGGRETRLTRGDPRFPALVTRMDGPVRADGKRRTMSATYNARGRLAAQTDSSTSELRIVFDPVDGHASSQTVYATTRYAYEDPHWPDFVTRIVQPEGETTTLGYDSATGHRVWQQVGPDDARRVSFAYFSNRSEPGYAPGLLRAVQMPSPPPIVTVRQECTGPEPESCTTVQDTVYPPPPIERVEYDTRGNVEYTITPRGYRTRYFNDDLGRTWKTQSPIDSVRVMTGVTTFEPNSDRVSTVQTTGPDMNGVPEQNLWVRNRYDEEGNVRFVERWSDRDDAGVQHILTEFRYDAIGRKRAEFAPDATPADTTDGSVERLIYDEAGNVKEVSTRRHDAAGTRLKITMTYDALNRLKTRNLPPVTYPEHRDGIAGLGEDKLQVEGGNRSYPWYKSPGTAGFAVPADVVQFGYDTLGNLVRADNGDALVRRAYNLNGTLANETQKIRTVAELNAGGDTMSHVYTLGYLYDLNGRRITLIHPRQLTPTPTGRDVTTYGYDPHTGLLDAVQDVLGGYFAYRYNARSELDALSLPGGITERYGYDEDGRPNTHQATNSTNVLLRDEKREHDRRGKILSTMNAAGVRDTLTAYYSGLGHVAATTFAQHGKDEYGSARRYSSSERFQHDAMANVYSSSYSANYTRGWGGNVWWGYREGDGSWSSGSARYHPGTGRLAYTMNSHIKDEYRYDGGGNTVFTTRTTGTAHRDRASYYGADGTLRAADYRTATTGGDPPIAPFQATFEEYRYDALGRRVWVRARRQCQNVEAPSECDISTLRRTVWDGDQELYEIQMPGEDGSSLMENDTAWVPNQGYDAFNMDRNPFFGRVAYAHGLGIDQPLSVTRIKYADLPIPGKNGSYHQWPAAFAMMPHWNSRGQMDGGSFADGGAQSCKLIDGANRCVKVAAPQGWFAYDRPQFVRDFWHGTLIEDKQDKAGTAYRRNRHYDPYAGRFTQEDPIGLAGGINLYGFANGDPVSYSDPYGLKVCYKGSASQVHQLRRGTEDAVGASVTLDRENCISGIGDGSKSKAELRDRLEHLAFGIGDHTVEVLFEAGPGGSARQQSYAFVENIHFPAGRKGVSIGTGFANANYATRLLSICFGFVKTVSPTLGSIMAHELLGHSYGQSLSGFTRATGEAYALAAGNIYERAAGMPERCSH